LFRSRDLDIDDLVKLGQRLLVVDASCRYVFPLRYGERFRVSAWVSDVGNRIHISYLVWNLTQDRRAAKAHTVLVATDGHGKLVWPTPPAIRKRLVPPL
jgi:acyl-CoA thioesterase FadM